jgi:hypothetical protein
MGFQVRLANLTNPGLFRGPCTELYPVGPLRLSARLPAGATAGGARLLVADQVVEVARREARVEVEVPSVTDHEVVVFEPE